MLYTVQGKAETGLYSPTMTFGGGSYLFDVKLHIITPSVLPSLLIELHDDIKEICDFIDHSTIFVKDAPSTLVEQSRRYCTVNFADISDVTVAQIVYSQISDFLDNSDKFDFVNLDSVTATVSTRSVTISSQNDLYGKLTDGSVSMISLEFSESTFNS